MNKNQYQISIPGRRCVVELKSLEDVPETLNQILELIFSKENYLFELGRELNLAENYLADFLKYNRKRETKLAGEKTYYISENALKKILEFIFHEQEVKGHLFVEEGFFYRLLDLVNISEEKKSKIREVIFKHYSKNQETAEFKKDRQYQFLDISKFSLKKKSWAHENVIEELLESDIPKVKFIEADPIYQRTAAALTFMPSSIFKIYKMGSLARRIGFENNEEFKFTIEKFQEEGLVHCHRFLWLKYFRIDTGLIRIINTSEFEKDLEQDFSYGMAQKGNDRVIFSTKIFRLALKRFLCNLYYNQRREVVYSEKESYLYREIISIEKILASEIKCSVYYSRILRGFLPLFVIYLVEIAGIIFLTDSTYLHLDLLLYIILAIFLYLLIFVLCVYEIGKYEMGWENVGRRYYPVGMDTHIKTE